MADALVTAIRATACGHVLALGSHPVMVAQMTAKHNALVAMDDTRFELVKLNADAATQAFADGLHCRQCVIGGTS